MEKPHCVYYRKLLRSTMRQSWTTAKGGNQWTSSEKQAMQVFGVLLATGIHNRSRCAVPGFGSTGIPSFLQLPWIRTENLIWLKHDGWSCRCFLRDGRLWNHRLLVGAKVLVSPRPKGMRWNINPAIMCSTAARLKVINNAVLRTPYRKLKEDTPDHLIAPVVPVPVPRIIFDWAISRRDETFLCLDHG